MYNVMIVDDVEIFRRDIKRLKHWGEASGFVITNEASDGIEALSALENNNVDLIISDIKMPNMSGIDLLKNVNERNLCPYTVLLSDYTDYNYARQGFIYHAFDYLGKPVNENDLINLLSRIRLDLDAKKKEKEKIQELQEIASDTFCSEADKDIIINLISNGDESSFNNINEIIEKIRLYFDNNFDKAYFTIKKVLTFIMDETIHKQPWIKNYCNFEHYIKFSDWNQLISALNEKLEKLCSLIKQFIGCSGDGLVRQASIYIIEHIEEDLSISLLAKKLFISKSYLCEKFKHERGISLLEFITKVKMERAKKLILENKLKNYEIAELLSFNDHEYFSKLFKKFTGMTITEFRHQ